MKTNSITIPRWFERHVHWRNGKMLSLVLPCTLEQRATGAVVMPNPFEVDENGDLVLDEKGNPIPWPIDSIERAISYKNLILTRIHQYHSRFGMSEEESPEQQFTPCLTCYLTDHTSTEEVVDGYKQRLWRAVKLYMSKVDGSGGTTGSAHGVRNLTGRYPVFSAMEKHGIPLLGHFEAVEDDVDEFDREIVSMERDLKPILKSFPGLPVVFEHITDGRAADFVAEYDHPGGIYATVTPHHLMINRNAMFKGGMNPLNYCKPVPKREEYRLAVRKHVTSGNRRFGAGTDSAPHDESMKVRSCGCAAGIFTPRAVEMYATVFDEDDAMEHYGPFMSENFLHIYGMKTSKERMTLLREPTKIPRSIGLVKVFMGGSTLPWRLAN